MKTFRGYFEENPRIPIYHTGDMSISTEEALRIILNPDKSRICHEQPLAITFSSTYVVDTLLLAHHDDLRADLGSWRNDGVKSLYCKVSNDAKGCIAGVVKLTNKKPLKKTFYLSCKEILLVSFRRQNICSSSY